MIRLASTALLATFLVVPAPAEAQDAPIVALLHCGERALAVHFEGGVATLHDLGAPGAARTLMADRTASGARHASADGETWVWSRGREARVQIDGDALPVCRLELLPITARGTEPFWSLTLGPERMRHDPLDAAPREAATPAPEAPADGVGWRFPAPEADLALILRPEICRDAMTGMPHPLNASVEMAEGALSGCAGAPADLLAGRWRVTAIGGDETPADTEVTLEFDADATRVSGSSGCNSYVTGASLSGEGLTFPGPVAGTRMACEAPRMALERRFLEALAGIDRFDLTEDGDLLLISADVPSIRAER